jgi:hypothetical protein
MGRVIRVGWLTCFLGAGCATAAPVDNPLLAGAPTSCVENPVLVSPGNPDPASYYEVFEKAVDILNEYFDLYTPNPYAGQIIAKRRIAPGYEQFWKVGNPDPRTRLLSTLQTIRQTARIDIRPGERGGFLVFVLVELELEDLGRPSQAKVGVATFDAGLTGSTVGRPYDVVTPELSKDEPLNWFKIGRDYALEQVILSRMRNGH